MLELTLARVFDVILMPNVAYTVITCAVFAYGLAGLYLSVRPLAKGTEALPRLAAGSAVVTLLLLPLCNLLPFDFAQIAHAPLKQLAAFGLLYVALVTPFFFFGLIITTLFSEYASAIRRLYCWDLVGAAVGCLVGIPLMPLLGPGGLLVLAAGLCLWVLMLFSRDRRWIAGKAAAAIALTVAPFVAPRGWLEFSQHTEKRGVKAARAHGHVEFSRWDPVAKIDVIRQNPVVAPGLPGNARWHVAYDDGILSTHFFAFNGDFARLRADIERGTPGVTRQNFWQRGVLASHYLKRDSGERALIIGSAGGQETKAALMYGASHVDAVELVSTVIELGKTRYAKATGNIFNNPHVSEHVGEGRSFLRASKKQYDVIQIFSSFSPRILAEGYGALQPVYLQTADAYREYFTHLQPDGILHINHSIYPRLVSTAALAWRQLGRTDFHRHVVVIEPNRDILPTLLIKMQPWTPEQVADLLRFFNADSLEGGYNLVVNPVGTDHNRLSEDFFTGEFPDSLDARLAYHATPTTDDRPFYYLLRKRIAPVKVDTAGYLFPSITEMLNRQLRRGWLPMDLAHLFVTGAVSLLFIALTIAIPLRYAPIGRAAWEGKGPTLTYFACLGAGFICLELVLIQLFIKLVGYPLYTYSVVIFVLLLAAGLGSLMSERFGITPDRRWTWPFVGVLASGTGLLLVHEWAFQISLAAPLPIRVLVAAVLLFPLGFFLGMPFPLGILVAGKLGNGAVAWGWALNGVFTVAGGLLTGLLSIWFGFQATIMIGLSTYVLAFAVFAAVRRLAWFSEPVIVPATPPLESFSLFRVVS